MVEEYNSVTVTGDVPTYSDDKTYTTPYTNSWMYSYSLTNTVYMYQIICPRCFETNWGQIDQIITCKGKLGTKKHIPCGAKLKAIKEKVDFEVAVG